jgi:hypothetical protein
MGLGAIPIRPIATAGNHSRSCAWHERRSRWLRDRRGPEPAAIYVLIPDEDDLAELRAEARAEAESRGSPWGPPDREDTVWIMRIEEDLPFGEPASAHNLLLLAKSYAADLLN